MAGLVRKSLNSPDETRPFVTGMAVVTAREADREDRKLPGCPHRIFRLRPDEGRDGRRRRDGIRTRRLCRHGAGARRVDRGRRALCRYRLAGLRGLRQAVT